MTELTRYDWGKRDDGEWDILPFTDGDCVKYADVAHLEQQAARLANLPGLPEGWKVETIKPYSGISEVTQPECRRLSQIFSETKTMNCGEFQFLLKLLNTCYPPAPGQEGGQEGGKEGVIVGSV